ncbi:hypothetical protein MRX96_055101 [Rhipicephalus microplus]
MAFAESHDTETSLLVEWMVSLNLDLGDERKLARVDPADMIVRCSLDLGVPAILSFELHNAEFYANKREMKISFSAEEDRWLQEHHPYRGHVNESYYSTLLYQYGLQHPNDTNLASKIVGYEKELVRPFEVEVAKKIVSNVRKALRETFRSSSWVTGRDRQISVRKLDKLTAVVGMPGPYLDVDFFGSPLQ